MFKIYLHGDSTMTINWVAFILVTIIQYVIGALWYSVVFGKQWLAINHPEGTPSKEEMKEMEKQATPYYAIQLLLTIGTNIGLLYVLQKTNYTDWLSTTFIVWLCFMVSMTVQNIIWSDPKNKLKTLQIGIITLHMIITLLIAGWAFTMYR
jgi:hypothetical protein